MGHTAVHSLKGESVVFTGIVRDRGEWVTRKTCEGRAKRAGASHVAEDLSGGTTVLVQGDLSSKAVADRKTGYSEKLTTVAAWRAEGHHVHVVDSDGFFALLAGHRALCRDLVGKGKRVRIKEEPGDEIFGGLLDPKPGTDAHSTAPLKVDLSKLDAGMKAHQRTLMALVKHFGDVQVRAPGSGAPLFDAGWEKQGTFFVAEVKSLTGTNQAQQIRLGLGQVLDYHHQLGAKTNMKPVLVLERAPDDDRWLQLCRRHGVTLTWGPQFPRV